MPYIGGNDMDYEVDISFNIRLTNNLIEVSVKLMWGERYVTKLLTSCDPGSIMLDKEIVILALQCAIDLSMIPNEKYEVSISGGLDARNGVMVSVLQSIGSKNRMCGFVEDVYRSPETVICAIQTLLKGVLQNVSRAA
jgi:hypothetical protein